MTIEELRERLILMGATEQQLKSKILEKAIFALGNENIEDIELYGHIESEKRRIETEKQVCEREKEALLEKEEHLNHKEYELNQKEDHIAVLYEHKLKAIEEKRKALYEHNIKAIEEKRKEFHEELKGLETPEARDRVRLLNVFLLIADRAKLPFTQKNLDIVGEILTGILSETDQI